MFIEYLKIYKGTELIRDIQFHKGVNFIIDKTPYSKGIDSGNNVGKTTVLRLIDYCLGSDGKDIYSDTEFKTNKNNELKLYLENNNFLIKLGLIDISGINQYVISRNFLSKKNKLVTLNEELVTESELRLRLNKLFFNNESAKPSFRYLISKFIRNTPHKMSRTLRYLHNTTTDVVYESIHLFLMGVALPGDLIEEKGWLESKIKSEKDVLARITEEGNTENALKQALIVINRDIAILEIEKQNFNIGKNEEAEIDELNNVKFHIAKLSSVIGENEIKLKLILESVSDLEENKNSYDIDTIKDIYNEANLYIPNLQKRFEEVVKFHNSMLENKIKFLSKDLPFIKSKITESRSNLSQLLQRERELLAKLNAIFKIQDYDDIITDLNSKYELKGSKEERYNQAVEIGKSVVEKSARLKEISDKMELIEPTLDSNIATFNEYFSNFSKILYGEEFYLSYEKTNGNYKFNVRNIQANIGGGKKKGQIAAFDLAYIKFCDEKNIPSPRFILHDSTEDVSINQLMIINEIASSINCQYIVAILKDKYSGNEEQFSIVENNKIIELSQSSKLFKF